MKTSWPQSFAFLFVLKVVKETGPAKAKHLRVKYVWKVGWSTLYTFMFATQATAVLDWDVEM